MSKLLAVTAERIFDGERWLEDSALLFERGRIVKVEPQANIPPKVDRYDYTGQTIVPGFIDLQVNGGGGVRFGDETSAEAIEAITLAHAKFGTTKLLPTLITDTPEITARALAGGLEAHEKKVAGFLGLHLEGPHLSIERKGAHNPDYIRSMTPQDLDSLLAYRAQSGFLLTTIAPESVTVDQASALARYGVVVSIGHSNATAVTARAYFNAGATMVTHLFNAMSQLGNREPGIVGASIADGRVFAGLITDGVHVDPETIKIALRAKTGPGQIFLVTDAMQTIGTELASFELNGRTIKRSQGSLKLADGTLAGADIDMLASIKFVHSEVGFPLEEALQLATSSPAKAARVDASLGYLKPGYIADFVVLDSKLAHVDTWIDGRNVTSH